MISNEKGVTLVELIAALALVGLIATIGWTMFSVGFQHSSVEVNKTQLQQDANLLMTTLATEHRSSDAYYIRMQGGQLELKTCDEAMSVVTCGNFQPVIEADYTYCGTINGKKIESNAEGCAAIIDPNLPSWNESCKLEPKKKNVDISLTMIDPEIPKNPVSLTTTLTRIITQQSEGSTPDEESTEVEACA